jgi:hypothetical protein
MLFSFTRFLNLCPRFFYPFIVIIIALLVFLLFTTKAAADFLSAHMKATGA